MNFFIVVVAVFWSLVVWAMGTFVNNSDLKYSLPQKEIEAMSNEFAEKKISVPMYLQESAINTSRRYSYCFKYLFEVPGMQSRVQEGWKVNFVIGYITIKEKMYLFYRCDENFP